MVFKGVPGQPSLSPVPAELQDEAQSMFKAGMAAARSRPMFRILHDKVPYRFTRLETIDGEEWSIRPLMQDVPEVSRLGQIGRAHVCTPVTNAQPVCRLLL